MIRSLHTSASGMEAQQFRIDVISNNLANVNTTGFKKSRAEFQDLFYQEVRAARAGGAGEDRGQAAPLEVGLGVRPTSTQKMFTAGDFIQTNNSLDLAIEGDGFFKVRMQDGSNAYTRAGSFVTDKDGVVVTQSGNALDPPIIVPTETQSITVDKDGTVKALFPGETDAVEIGRVELAQFTNPSGLKSVGYGLYQQTETSGVEILGTPGEGGLGAITQGMLETSNVKVVEEMIDLIAAQRAYEINSKVVRAADEMLRESSNLR